MEKFYMQDLQSKKESKVKKGLQKQINFSVAFSVMVAAFALFSIASFGIINGQRDTISYAAPAEGFTVKIPDPDEDVVSLISIGGTDEQPEGLNVPLYYANTVGANNRVFCVEMRNTVAELAEYHREDLTDDMGLVYILRNTMANNKTFTGYTGTNAEYVEVWATQAAIWLYLAEQYPDEEVFQFHNATDADVPHMTEDDPDSMIIGTKKGLETATKLMFWGGSQSGDEFAIPASVTTNIRNMVNQAKEAAKSSSSVVLSLSVGDELSKTSDGKYYQTALVNVTGTPANSLKSYDIVSVTGIDGAKIVDENDQDLALTAIPAGKKFRLRVPVSKVTEKTQVVKVLVNGHFSVPSGVYFVSEGNQKLIALEEGEDTDQKGIEYEIVGAPDTGMNAAQTIYFIGLIVLLCGVGIVYANTKPVESKQ